MKPIYASLLALLILVFIYIAIETSLFQDKLFDEKKAASTAQPLESMSEVSISEIMSSASLHVPAVDTNGNGISTILTVTTKPGTGKVLTDINVLLFWVDTQQSIQTAKKVAKDITGIDTDNIDLEYTIKIENGNTSLVGGPSAGAALTLATIAALQNKTLKKDIAITGTINENGKIGKVGAILEKAKAAKETGAKTFLVPVGESSQIKIIPDEKCIKAPGFVYCETSYRQLEINVGESIGIEIKEVDTIKDALEYFL